MDTARRRGVDSAGVDAARFGCQFWLGNRRITSGGTHEFDAVSGQDGIYASISTSRLRNAAGKIGAGKVCKIRSDLFFLLLATASRRLCVLTEEDMFEFWFKERQNGRVPESIEFQYVELPFNLRRKLEDSRRIASDEVSPR